jgi:Fe-S oxidoreductase
MCPSFKVSAELRHSPKGRAESLRALRQAQLDGRPTKELEEDVFSALDGCFGCKSCAGSCPAHVDIPEMKSRFLSDYYGDRLLIWMERFSPALQHIRPLMRLMSAAGLQDLGARLLGMVDTPHASPRGLAELGYPVCAPDQLGKCKMTGNTVLLVPDLFTALFDTTAIDTIANGMHCLGLEPIVLALKPAGKTAHVKGDRKAFMQQAEAFAATLREAAKSGAPLIGVDPALDADRGRSPWGAEDRGSNGGTRSCSV